MMENILLAQQNQDEFIKQLASKVDMFSTHNKMLKAQTAQQATSLSTPPGRLPSKHEPNPRERCNYVILSGGLEGSEGVRLEERREVNQAVSKEQSDELETISFRDESN